MPNQYVDVTFSPNNDLGSDYNLFTAHLSFKGMPVSKFTEKTYSNLQLFYLATISHAKYIITQLNANVIAIDLSGNSLGAKEDIDIISIVQSFSPNIISVDLSWNELDEKPTESLVQIFSAFSERINKVNLSWNNFGFKSGTELKQIFNALSKNISIVNLERNNLGWLDLEQLQIALSGIGPNVKIINLSNNDISPELFSVIQSFLPETVEVFYMDGQVMNKSSIIDEIQPEPMSISSINTPFTFFSNPKQGIIASATFVSDDSAPHINDPSPGDHFAQVQ
ncbi:MAG: hypothetical protein ACRCXC_06955 [Legionella sp.]